MQSGLPSGLPPPAVILKWNAALTDPLPYEALTDGEREALAEAGRLALLLLDNNAE